MTPRRLAWIIPAVLVATAVAYTAWLVWQVQGELRAAEESATELQAAWRSQDVDGREAAADDLADDAGAARAHTEGVWWRALGHLPIVGDDASGVAAMSKSLDVIARDAVAPLGQTVDNLDGLVIDGRIDLGAVADLEEPVQQAHAALVAAEDDLAGLDSDSFVDSLRTRFDDYADLVHDLRTGLASADTAVGVLPAMAGADGARDYLLIFQNNAELRATGGLPGSWALVHAEHGALGITRQGSANDFAVPAQPLGNLSRPELAVYGSVFGQYFHDAGFTPDFPRAADLWRAHWDVEHPDEPIDGVVAIDPVALSYLLEGTGPVVVDGTTLDASNVVPALLSDPYLHLTQPEQDVYFQRVARAIFEATTRDLASPVDFVDGLARATSEGRLRVASFDADVRDELEGTGVEGALAGDDGETPHVDVGLNDLTGSKMSYYVRYDGSVAATDCVDDTQRLVGSMTLRQVISPDEAKELPVSVTGGGQYGTDPGSQYVMVRIYGPWGGSIDEVRLDGRTLDAAEPIELDGRPVVSVDVLLSSLKVSRLAWDATTGPGQTGSGQLHMTPSVVPGDDSGTFGTAC